MEVYFSPYKLTPLIKANHLSDLKPKAGVFLKTEKTGTEIADYFPHLALGDQPIETFLENFPQETNSYHQSIIRQLKKMKEDFPETLFLNHQLWQKDTKMESPVIKYKIMNKDEELPNEILNSQCRIRLDANGIFEGKEIFNFLHKMNTQQIARIDYIEDPCKKTPWSDIPIPTAKDFLEQQHFQTLIYKPNRIHISNLPASTIFSGYMGSQLGTLHSYRELLKRGDLSVYHGLLTPGLYNEESSLFKGDFHHGFILDKLKVKKYLEEVNDQNWTHLCSL